MSIQSTGQPEADQVLLTTRLLAAVIIPFLAAASVILLVVPGQTDRLFAWGIGPPMTAMVLGSTYAGGIVFFGRVLFANTWSSVALGFPPVIGFATTLGLVTLLHWDRFTHDHVAFWVWTGLYFTTPAIVLTVWLRNRNLNPTAMSGVLMSLPLRMLLAATGSGIALVSLALFLSPATMAELWPWALSPLTARTLAAAFLLPTVLTLAVALDGRWWAARIPFEAQVVALALVLLSVIRGRDDFEGNETEMIASVAALLSLLGVSATIYACATRQSTRRVSDEPDEAHDREASP